MTIHQRVLRALQKRYPRWHIDISGARRKRGTKRTFTIATMAMHPKRGRGWRIGGIVEAWEITI